MIVDEMMAVGFNYTNSDFMFSIIRTVFNNHEKDNAGTNYKGWSVE